MLTFKLKSPQDIQEEIGKRFQKQRLLKNLSRNLLSEKSGVSVESIKRFELKGEISLKSMVLLSQALDRINEMDSLMKIEATKEISTFNNRQRQRGRL